MTHFHSTAHPQNCLFCRITRGAAPAHLVHQDERLVAFLDIQPIRPGHLQIVPRDHYACFDDLPPDLAAEAIRLGQRLAVLLKRTERVRRVSFCFTGSDIAHAHAHIVPLHAPTDITSRRYIAEETLTFRPTPRVADAELAAQAQRLRGEFAALPPTL
jgi:histidine triad (HIT) family protein